MEIPLGIWTEGIRLSHCTSRHLNYSDCEEIFTIGQSAAHLEEVQMWIINPGKNQRPMKTNQQSAARDGKTKSGRERNILPLPDSRFSLRDLFRNKLQSLTIAGGVPSEFKANRPRMSENSLRSRTPGINDGPISSEILESW